MERLTTMTFLTPADLLATGLQLPALDMTPVEVPEGVTCAITGQPIAVGYPVADMVTKATAEFLDCFRGGVDGWVSEAAARCFKSANPRVGNPCARSHLVFADGTYYMPFISRDSAAKSEDRPCWSDLVREVWPERAGQQCLIMLTTDTKKRLWIRARVGCLGSQTAMLVYDSGSALNEVRLIDWPRLIDCLDIIEAIYTAGFSKAAIGESLYGQTKAIGEVGIRQAREWENQLRGWRPRPEFAVALLIAQKQEQEQAPEKQEEGEKPCQISLW
jgi:hypothetical protein